MHEFRPSLTTALLITALSTLPACGGGGDIAEAVTTPVLSVETSQGYSADASAMPVTTATALDAIGTELEAALASTVAGKADSTAGALDSDTAQRSAATSEMQARATSPTISVPCPGGGTVAWTISGGTLVQQLNGQLDAGERYDIVFSNCSGSAPGLVLDGAATLSVTARSDTASDLMLESTMLKLRTVQGQFVLDGSARAQRSVVAVPDGGASFTTRLASARLTLATDFGDRQASYELQALDWTVARTQDATGTVTARSHQGALNLLSSTPRRPAATLSITTQGSLSVDNTVSTAQGSLTLRTATDTLTVVHAAGTVTLSLDAGNDGSIDRGWSISRELFNREAG